MPDHHDAQDYTANGPTNAGFRTGGDGTGIENGVVASGIVYGVHGIGLGARGTGLGAHDSTAGTAGVCGESSDAGVVGKSVSGTGVHGQSVEGYGVNGYSRDGIGVEGSGRTGVRGVARKSPAEPGGEQRPAGVHGDSEAGPGVLGDSERGVGVEGHGGTYGGVFEGNLAPLLLKPAKALVGPPRISSHQAGELFVDRRGALFYCAGGSPPQWEQLAGPQRSWVTDFVYRIRALWGG